MHTSTKFLFTISLALMVTSCGDKQSDSQDSLTPQDSEVSNDSSSALDDEPVVPAEPIAQVEPEPVVQFTMSKEQLFSIFENENHEEIYQALGTPFEKDEEINKYRESIWRYRGDISQKDGPTLKVLEIKVNASRSPKILSFGFPETYDADRSDSMMDEPVFRAATNEKTYEEVVAELGEPTFFKKKNNSLIYRMWIKRDNRAFPGVTLHHEDGIYRDYSFHQDGAKDLAE